MAAPQLTLDQARAAIDLRTVLRAVPGRQFPLFGRKIFCALAAEVRSAEDQTQFAASSLTPSLRLQTDLDVTGTS
jgi:hypothetical protein